MTRLRAYVGVRLLRPWLVVRRAESAVRLADANEQSTQQSLRSGGYHQGCLATFDRILKLYKN